MEKNKRKTQAYDIVLAGVGGQGVVLASKIILQFFLKGGWMVKKSEIHGMAQRGGSVVAHVRVGKKVYSPVIETGKADFLLAIDYSEGHFHRKMLSETGYFIALSDDDEARLLHRKNRNVAVLSKFFYELIHSCRLKHPHFTRKAIEETMATVIAGSSLQINQRVFDDYFNGNSLAGKH